MSEGLSQEAAFRIHGEVLEAARAEIALAIASDPEASAAPHLTDEDQAAIDLGIQAGFVATIRALVREGLLPCDREEDR